MNLPVFFLVATAALAQAAPIERIWLSYADASAAKLTVNWESTAEGDSVVEYGATPALGERAVIAGKAVRHHVEIPAPEPGKALHYRVRTGAEASEIFATAPAAGDVLRVAIVADWGYAPGRDVAMVLKDEIHLLLTAGDNVPSLHEKGKEGAKAFAALIDSQPALFRSTPFMPILGNHDRELTSRGPKPPEHAVYDVEARAYREFLALPGDEWKWHLDLAAFGVRFIALDLNHIQDFGTTWQTCHPWQPDSEQFRWYQSRMEETKAPFVFTLMNEKQTQVNGLTKGAWHEQMRRGSALVSGFGYFAERAELADGLPYFNTCLKGDGTLYKDPRSAFVAREDNYLLLTFHRGASHALVQLKNLRGKVLDTREIHTRPVR